MGNGNRTASFVKLRKFPKDMPNDSWYQTRSIILEALFYRAFRNHHAILCRTDKPNENARSSGLNVVPPLVQGNVMLSQLLRVQARVGPNRSPDPQIRHWAVFNPTHNKAIRIEGRPSFQYDIDILLLGGSQAFFLFVKKCLQRKSTSNTHARIEIILFVNSLSASIRFVLNYAAVSEASHTLLNPVRRESSDISHLVNELPDDIYTLLSVSQSIS